MTRLVVAIYLVAVVVLIAVLWHRIGAWDDAHDEIARRRHRDP